MAVLELAKQLIACPSVTPHDYGCQDLIKTRLQNLGFQCETLQFNAVTNLWARIGEKEPLFVFAGHTDVVPTGPENDWTSPPFSPTIRDGYLFGRGASDMKIAVAAMMIAVENFLQKHRDFKGSIAFLLTSDEEGIAIDGTRQVMTVLSERKIPINYCIVGEPSSEFKVGDQIRIGRRGSLHGKLIVHGKQGHVAHPHLAINPIHKVMSTLTQLTKTNWDNGNHDFPATTFQITNIHGGTGATNVVPGHIEILFNLRFSNESTVESIKERVENLLNKEELKYNLEWNVGAEPFLTKKGKLLSIAQETITEIVGKPARTSTGGGTSDARFIAPTGAEVLELGVSHATAHHVDENVSIEDMEKLAQIYERILHKLFCN